MEFILKGLNPSPQIMQTAKTAIICARVSTDEQAESGRSITSQLAVMRHYAEQHGFDVIGELTDDISGTVAIRQRPGGRELYRFIDDRKCDAVIFHAVDRVARDEDGIEILQLRRDVRIAGMTLHYAADGGQADLTTMGGALDYFKALGASEERKKIIERTQRGRKAKALAGKWVGGNAPPYGYRKIGERKATTLEIDATEALIVRRIFEAYIGMYGLPMSLFAIKQALNAEGIDSPGRYGRAMQGKCGWHQTIIATILRRKAYAGTFKYAGIDISLPHLAIVSERLYELAQQRLTSRATHRAFSKKREYLLSGRLRCACGRGMVGYTLTKKNGSAFKYYKCVDAAENTSQRTCRERMVRADWAEGAAWAWLKRIGTDDGYLREALAIKTEHNKQDTQPKQDWLEALQTDIAKQARKLQRLTSAYAEADDNEQEAIRAESKETSRKLSTLKTECEDLEREIGQGVAHEAQREAIVETLARLKEKIINADYPARRYMIDRLDVRGRMAHEGGARKIKLNLAILGDSPLVKDSESMA